MFYDEKEEWSQAILLYDSALREINTKLEILNNEFKLAHRYNPIEHITSRIKSPQSIAKKIRHKNLPLTIESIVKHINDVAGIRIICSFTSDIYRIADLIAKQSDVKVLKIKDYIMCPKENGYMSYHMIVCVPIFLSNNVIDTKIEIQIRTIAMDFWASLEHKIYYKFEGNAPESIRKQLKECADIVSFLDQKMLSINDDIQSYHQEAERKVGTSVFQDMMKASYGTVYTQEDVTVEKRYTKMSDFVDATIEGEKFSTNNDSSNYGKTHKIKEEAQVLEKESDIIDIPDENQKKESTGFFFRKRKETVC